MEEIKKLAELSITLTTVENKPECAKAEVRVEGTPDNILNAFSSLVESIAESLFEKAKDESATRKGVSLAMLSAFMTGESNAMDKYAKPEGGEE